MTEWCGGRFGDGNGKLVGVGVTGGHVGEAVLRQVVAYAIGSGDNVAYLALGLENGATVQSRAEIYSSSKNEQTKLSNAAGVVLYTPSHLVSGNCNGAVPALADGFPGVNGRWCFNRVRASGHPRWFILLIISLFPSIAPRS